MRRLSGPNRSPSWLLAVGLSIAACSGADQTPLGGPHGGAASQSVAAGTGSSSGAGGSSSSGGTSPGGSSSGSSGNEDAGSPAGGADAGATTCAAGPAPATAPTFTQLYTKYFEPGGIVDCTAGATCHTEFKSEATGWAFLEKYGQVGTTPPGLTDPNTSWLIWYGGAMPQSGTPCNPQAVADLNAWAAAGGQDN